MRPRRVENTAVLNFNLPLQSRERAEELGRRRQVAVLQQIGGQRPPSPGPPLLVLLLLPLAAARRGGHQQHLPLQAAAGRAAFRRGCRASLN